MPDTTTTPTLKPAWQIRVDDNDITTVVSDRLVSLALRDLRGMQADTLTLELDDSDGALAIPSRGAKLSLALGWGPDSAHAGHLVDKGKFIVDDVAHDGPPDRLRITARSADFRDSLKAARERDWDDYTLGEILDFIAGDHNLAPAVSPDLAAINVPHLDQTNESDAHFLTRLAKRYDAIATVKAERLLFVHKGRGITATGQPLPTLELSRQDGDTHHWEETDRESRYTGVKAFWDDKPGGRREFVVVGADGYLRTLRDPFPTENEAHGAAAGEWGRLKRAEARMDLTLAIGRPDILPEQPAVLDGWKERITARGWVVGDVLHKIDGRGGYTTALQLEARLDL